MAMELPKSLLAQIGNEAVGMQEVLRGERVVPLNYRESRAGFEDVVEMQEFHLQECPL